MDNSYIISISINNNRVHSIESSSLFCEKYTLYFLFLFYLPVSADSG